MQGSHPCLALRAAIPAVGGHACASNTRGELECDGEGESPGRMRFFEARLLVRVSLALEFLADVVQR